MDASAKIELVLELYQNVLELSRSQLSCLETKNLAELPAILQNKTDQIEQAGTHMAQLKDLDISHAPDLQDKVNDLAGIMGQVMEIEDRCQALVAKPVTPPSPSAGRVANLYKQGGK